MTFKLFSCFCSRAVAPEEQDSKSIADKKEDEESINEKKLIIILSYICQVDDPEAFTYQSLMPATTNERYNKLNKDMHKIFVNKQGYEKLKTHFPAKPSQEFSSHIALVTAEFARYLKSKTGSYYSNQYHLQISDELATWLIDYCDQVASYPTKHQPAFKRPSLAHHIELYENLKVIRPKQYL